VDNSWECSTHDFGRYKRFIKFFSVIGDKIYYSDNHWHRLYLPRNQREAALQRFHDQLGHLGADSILDLIKRRYFWPALESEVKQYVKSCTLCQLARSRGGVPKPPAQSIPPVAVPFERLGLDFLSNLPLTKNGNRHCITCVDYATRWLWAWPVKEMTASVVIKFLYHQILMFVGAPFEIITDRGSNFLSEPVKQFLDLHNIKHLKTSPYHPATNGMIERLHGMVNHGITAMVRSRVNRWDEFVDQVVFGIRVRTHAVTKVSPFYLLFGINPRIPGDLDPPNQVRAPLDELERQVAANEFQIRELEDLGQTRAAAHFRSLEQAKKMESGQVKTFYFEIGDWVKRKNRNKSKFNFSWNGPFVVVGFGPFPTYWLMKPDGQRFNTVVNQVDLAPWTARVNENESYFTDEQEIQEAELINNEDFGAFPEEGDDVEVNDALGLNSGVCSGLRQGYLFPF
jgi:Mor family transcriptional regulator